MQISKDPSRTKSPILASATSEAQQPITPTPAGNAAVSRRISTLRREATELFSHSPFSSSNPFDADDFEFAPLASPTRTLRGNPVTSVSDTLVRPTHALSLLYKDCQEMYEGTDFSSDSMKLPNTTTLYPRSSQRSTSNTLESLTSVPPRVSTLRRRGADILSGSPFLSSNPWDADEHEFDQTGNGLVSLDATIRGNPSKSTHVRMPSSDNFPQNSIQKSNRRSRHETADQFPILSGKSNKVKLHDQFSNLALSLKKTFRNNSFTLEPDTSGKSTRYSSSRPTPGMWDKPADGMLDKETKQENKSIWDADDDEFENWPGQDA